MNGARNLMAEVCVESDPSGDLKIKAQAGLASYLMIMEIVGPVAANKIFTGRRGKFNLQL